MATAFFALFDDIAAMMDDVAMMTKAATKKTAGVLGDDLALNANQLTGIRAERELPVVWAVTKGSLVNKVILVPLALLLSAFYPPALKVLLMIGGAYLCYEGIEKVWHTLFGHKAPVVERQQVRIQAIAEGQDLVAMEKEKIKGAILTDFILSAEIIVIAMGVVINHKAPISEQAITLSLLALLVTFFIYGVVAIIVKLDDVGQYWVESKEGLLDAIGHGLLWLAPNIIRVLAFVGTLAMFIVGGHIWIEGIAYLHHLSANINAALSGFWQWLASTSFDIAVGAALGLLIFLLLTPVLKWWKQRKASAHE